MGSGEMRKEEHGAMRRGRERYQDKKKEKRVGWGNGGITSRAREKWDVCNAEIEGNREMEEDRERGAVIRKGKGDNNGYTQKREGELNKFQKKRERECRK